MVQTAYTKNAHADGAFRVFCVPETDPVPTNSPPRPVPFKETQFRPKSTPRRGLLRNFASEVAVTPALADASAVTIAAVAFSHRKSPNAPTKPPPYAPNATDVLVLFFPRKTQAPPASENASSSSLYPLHIFCFEPVFFESVFLADLSFAGPFSSFGSVSSFDDFSSVFGIFFVTIAPKRVSRNLIRVVHALGRGHAFQLRRARQRY